MYTDLYPRKSKLQNSLGAGWGKGIQWSIPGSVSLTAVVHKVILNEERRVVAERLKSPLKLFIKILNALSQYFSLIFYVYESIRDK